MPNVQFITLTYIIFYMQQSFHQTQPKSYLNSHMYLQSSQGPPILSNTTLYQRMFRIKPYTKCIECLTNDKLKCKKCMQEIIQNISKCEQQPKKLIRARIFIRDFNGKTNDKFRNHEKDKDGKCFSVSRLLDNKQNINRNRSISKQKQQQKVMITSKYNWWIQQKLRRKYTQNSLNSNNSNDQLKGQTMTNLKSYWPRKTRMNDFNLQFCGAKQPKFQKWEKKLLDKLLQKPAKAV